jgi:parvulin-like peptidyl-prolyl isomerase
MYTRQITPAGILVVAVIFLMALGAPCSAASATGATPATSMLFARVYGKPIAADLLMEKIELLYPRASVHGNQGGSAELRQKAMDEVILDELIWQQAVKSGKVVSFAKAEQEMLRFRRRYGPQKFDAELRQSKMSRHAYVVKFQRTLTIQQARKQHVEIPSKVGLQATRAFYESNKNRFHRPERVRFRLILVAVAPKAPTQAEQQAKKKADDLYAQLKGGKDFGDLASEVSDDMYRAMGGDVGWMHKGGVDAEFDPIAFSLPVGQFTAPFRTTQGFNLMKVEGREPAKDMSFEEVRDKLQAQLTMQKSNQLQQDWEASLKKSARVEIVDKSAGASALDPVKIEKMSPVSAH